MIDLINVVRSELTTWGFATEWVHLHMRLLAIALVALIAYIAHALARGPVLKAIFAIIRRTDTSWDDALVEERVLHRLVHLVPGMVIYRIAPVLLAVNVRV